MAILGALLIVFWAFSAFVSSPGISSSPNIRLRPLPALAQLSDTVGLIAFHSDRDGHRDDIYVMNADGSDVRRLTNNSVADWFPSWSPDGRRIAFASARDGDFDIYVMNADSSDVRPLTDNSAWDGDPSWSPDGRRIAFMSDRDGDNDIFVMNADGSGVRRLTDNSAYDGDPSWSPDGGRIAFTSARDGDRDIFVISVDGLDVRPLTYNSDRDEYPSWSPDGGRIAFMSDRDGDRDIYVMNADGSDVRQLTDNSYRDKYPSWSPDGRRIAFASAREDVYSDIYVMNADGSGVRRLTYTSAHDEFPSWSHVSTPTPTATTPTPDSPEPRVSLYAEATETVVGLPVKISLTVANISSNPDLDVDVALEAQPGLSLTGNSCSTGQCWASYRLSGGQREEMQLNAIANQSGDFVLKAEVTWNSRDGTPARSYESIALKVIDRVEGETSVTIHASQTEVNVGESVLVTLAVTNSIVKPTMTLTLLLKIPSGWSLSGAGFTESCAGQCVATHTVAPGKQKNIEIQVLPNQAGSASVEAEMEWYFGEDKSILERKVDTLDLNAVVKTPTPTPTPCPPPGFCDPDSECPPSSGVAVGNLLTLLVPLAMVGGLSLTLRSRRRPKS